MWITLLGLNRIPGPGPLVLLRMCCRTVLVLSLWTGSGPLVALLTKFTIPGALPIRR